MSRQTLAMPSVLTERIKRGLTPSTTQGWVIEDQDPENFLQHELGEWLKAVSENQALFQKHVYENNDLTASDLRQHRGRICGLIEMGDLLAMGFGVLGQKTGKVKNFEPLVKTIDQTVKNLFDKLIAWHGPLSAQSDIPESFKQASREVEEGKVVELDI